ncbi:M1 family aminopeptidase [Solirubrobacter ginsenosidimutans]|uniref:M1 family aminopeptidase n=2 Tax=Solirubrobacter ginsenosidimutans TaxID=490573 RepID=A0A9X3S2K1_9ACTN|nr:M1 family aminopeptidase [Solirubrobacter ginsenosidimutans]
MSASLITVGMLGVTAASAVAAPTVSVSAVSSLKAGARAGTLSAMVVNETARARVAKVTVRLMRGGMKALVVGTATARVDADSSATRRVRVKLPAGLHKGNYYLSACTPLGVADAGKLGCATARKDVLIGGGIPVRGPEAMKPFLKAKATAHAAQAPVCSSGAHTLSKPGTRVYPEVGNGGYLSLHTDIFTVYDANTNLFLPGNHVDLLQRSTQCLSDFSLDFDRKNSVTSTTTPGPDMTVDSITVNGQPATFKFVQPTYPGDPNGQDDPDPLAHVAALTNPVSATNPNPPACAPTGTGAAAQGVQCPATKLVITPSAPIPSGTDFKVTVNYTGRPGIRPQGSGSAEGWFRNNSPAGDGAMVTSEPLGSMTWMPLNDYTASKPTYDIHSTVNYDPTLTADQNRVFIGNGRLVSTTVNPPDANYPTGGSRTFYWKSAEPIAAYLVENSVGHFSLAERVATSGDVLYYEAQAANITDTRKASNKVIMDQQEDITHFQEQFNGPFPFNANGILIALPSASFEEEMQTKIVFVGGSIGNNASTFSHENMHQWWGDNVSYSEHRFTFFKEGYATTAEHYFAGNTAGLAAGPVGSAAYNTAFEATLVTRFNAQYNTTSTSYWTVAPSNPTSGNLFGQSNTYARPGASYLALRAIMGKDNFNAASKQIQHDFGGGSVSEAQLIAVFHKYMPNQSIGCANKLDAFFKQWWDTAYSGTPAAGNRPSITGPGLAGGGFYDVSGGCSDYGTDVTAPAGGSVPATLSLTIGAPATFGPFTPGVAKDYTASTTANVISSAGDAALTSSDPGHLMNGTFALPSPLEVSFSKSAWTGPTANESVSINFKQHIGATDALRTGAYSKTLTFTLSTTTP